MHTGTDQVQIGRKFTEFLGIPMKTNLSKICCGQAKEVKGPVSETNIDFEGLFHPCKRRI